MGPMNHRVIIPSLAIALCVFASVAAAGEVVLTGTRMKALHDSREDVVYDVCVKPEAEAGPVIVTAGSGTIVLKPGDCHQMSGAHITARPETALTGAMRSTVTFRDAGTGPR